MNFFVCAVSGIISGIFASLGMGGGGVLIICLTLFLEIPQQQAQGINLIFFILPAIFSVIIYTKRKLIVWKIAAPFAILGIGGAIIGSLLSMFIDGYWLSKLFGIMLLIIGAKELFKKSRK